MRPPWKSMNHGLPSFIITLRDWKSRYMNVADELRSSTSARRWKSSSSLLSENSRPVVFRKQYLK